MKSFVIFLGLVFFSEPAVAVDPTSCGKGRIRDARVEGDGLIVRYVLSEWAAPTSWVAVFALDGSAAVDGYRQGRHVEGKGVVAAVTFRKPPSGYWLVALICGSGRERHLDSMIVRTDG